jgi:hypothetical protein
MRNLCARSDARARRERESCRLAHLLERERIELWRDLALEPGLVTLLRMLARPVAIAAMPQLRPKLPIANAMNQELAKVEFSEIGGEDQPEDSE